MILVTLAVAIGLFMAAITAAWLFVRVGALREPRWSASLRRRNPPLRGGIFFGVGLICGGVFAAGAFLIVDLAYHQADLWIRQLRAILIGTASLAGGGLVAQGWFQLARLQRRKPPGS